MNKTQALYNFWSDFELNAYDETSVPDSAQLPYITYENADDSFGNEIAISASVWYRSTSWKDVTEKVVEISDAITRGGKLIVYDGGAFWIRKGSPWAQRMSDGSDDSIRRIVLNLVIEFLD